jgi:hypothetical protein
MIWSTYSSFLNSSKGNTSKTIITLIKNNKEIIAMFAVASTLLFLQLFIKTEVIKVAFLTLAFVLTAIVTVKEIAFYFKLIKKFRRFR